MKHDANLTLQGDFEKRAQVEWMQGERADIVKHKDNLHQVRKLMDHLSPNALLGPIHNPAGNF